MKSVYTGGEKVAEFESYDELRLGENKPAFIYEGNELVYPNPVKDGLVLWYDFSGRTNTDGQRGVAEDLSGNGNHGTLQNFNYTSESGYDKNKLLFDGVDDKIQTSKEMDSVFTLEVAITPLGANSYGGIIGSYINIFGSRSGVNLSLYEYSDGTIQPRVIAAAAGDAQRIFTGAPKIEKLKTTHLVVSIDNESIFFYMDGFLIYKEIFNNYISKQKTDGVSIDNIGIILGQWNTYNAYRYEGRIHSARVYNRPLTPSQIAHNYAIEKERFGIE